MRYAATLLGSALLFAGCAAQEAALPPTPPVPDDMPAAHEAASWSTPNVLPLPSFQPAPPPPPPIRPAGVNEKLYPFVDGREYAAEVSPGWPLTLVLEPGEQFTGLVGGERPLLQDGEQPPWEMKQTPEGAAQQHVFLTVTKPGLQMGMVVTTTRRTYYLTVKSVPKTAIRAIRWSYPPVASPVVTTGPTLFPAPGQSVYLHVGYHLDTPWPVPDWAPAQVVDNGAKIFILFPVTMLHQEAPMVRGIGANGPYLLNSRQVNRVLIVDHLAQRLELRVGTGKTAEVVTITRRLLQRITCPGDGQCPVWPAEPAWLAQGGTP